VTSLPTPYMYHVVECKSFPELQKAFNENRKRIGFYFYGVYQIKDSVALVFASAGAPNTRVPTLKELKKELAVKYANKYGYPTQLQLLEDFLRWIQEQGFTIAIL